MPRVGDRCHFDRNYVFESLGSFARPEMFFILASNDDRRTPVTEVITN